MIGLESWVGDALTSSMLVAIPVAMLAGVVSFVSPCVLPLLPGYLSYASGLGAAEIASGEGPRRLLIGGSLGFVLGFSGVFVLTGAAIGAASCGVGRRILESKIVPLLSLCVDANGDLDIPGLRESVYAGFEVAKSVPVLGGIISVDVQDARDFFATLPEQS